MNKHCPIDPIVYAVGVAERALEGLADYEVSTADSSTLRRIAEGWLETLQQAERDLTPEQIERAVDSGKAHLTREYR